MKHTNYLLFTIYYFKMSSSDKSCSDKSCSDVSCSETICNICFDTIGQTNSTTTPCGHQFCFKCIIKAYQHNPICPCCRKPLNDTEEAEPQNIEDIEEEVESGYNPTPWRGYPWREGRLDFEDPEVDYYFPAIIETVHDIHRVLCVTSGAYTHEESLHVLMHLMDPSYKFYDGVYDETNSNIDIDDENLKDLCAMDRLRMFKIAFDLYKKTQIIKKFAEKHIKNQRRGPYVKFEIKTTSLDDWLNNEDDEVNNNTNI